MRKNWRIAVPAYILTASVLLGGCTSNPAERSTDELTMLEMQDIYDDEDWEEEEWDDAEWDDESLDDEDWEEAWDEKEEEEEGEEDIEVAESAEKPAADTQTKKQTTKKKSSSESDKQTTKKETEKKKEASEQPQTAEAEEVTSREEEEPEEEEEEEEERVVPVKEIYQAITDKISLPSMYLADDSFLSSYCGIDASLLSEYIFASCDDSAQVDMLVLMRVKNEDDADAIVEKLDNLLEQLMAETEDYNPDGYDLVSMAWTRQDGCFIDLVISANQDEILEIIDEKLYEYE
ncbi:MAG: DUF4358 domain-containing protein [Lachnospiraceae bacterium]|nr:DUF4358 domain-containing protein [Lachnospiraceae bacterium]